MNKVVLENNEGKTIRFFSWSGERAKLIRRNDNLRMELLDQSNWYKLDDLDFIDLKDVESGALKEGIDFENLGRLRLVEESPAVINDFEDKAESSRPLWYAFLALFGFIFLSYAIIRFLPEEVPVEEKTDEKQKIVQVSPKIKIKARPTNQPAKTTKTRNIKRVGALQALGSLNSAKSKGGVDLKAIEASDGPGMGGKLGSGGVQKSINAKGVISAPLGGNENLKGAGGYGTKGKGGGKAGYGKLSMVGSVGTEAIALGETTTSAGGLDKDLIAAVIQKNIGQIRFCYEQGLQSNSGLSGRVAVNFVINASGKVAKANIANSSLQSNIVESCILMRLRSWAFPKPEGGANVKVSYPFVLKRLGQG